MNRITVIILLFLLSLGAVGQSSMKLAEVNKVEGKLNSEAEESLPIYSPDGRLYFVRTLHESNTGGKTSGQDIWYTEQNDEGWAEPSNDIGRLNNYYNNGVVGVADSGRTLYLNGTYSSKSEYQVGLSMSRLNEKGEWSRPKQLRIKGFDPKSPYLTFYVDGKNGVMIMSFTGKGEGASEDLYVSFRKKRNKWSKPMSLGTQVNTDSAEFSPFLADNGRVLYFSSNGFPGEGGVDVFRSHRMDDSWTNWSEPVNLGEPINSGGFDAYYTQFGAEAFFSSNRNSRLSDIYNARFEPILAEKKPMLAANEAMKDEQDFFELRGYLDNESREGIRQVSIFNDKGEEVSTMAPAEDGSFILKGMGKYSKYYLSLSGTQESMASAEIFVVNSDGDRVYLGRDLSLEKFPFETLDRDIRAILVADVANTTHLTSSGDKPEAVAPPAADPGSEIVMGFEHKKLPALGTRVVLVDEEGNTVAEAFTDAQGMFKFQKLDPDMKYSLKVEGYEDNARDLGIYLVSEEGVERPVSANILAGETFTGDMAAVSEVKTDEDAFSFQYNAVPAVGSKVYLTDAYDTVLDSAYVDVEGNFKFKKLDPTKAYLMRLAEEGDGAVDMNYFIVDASGQEMKLSSNTEKGDAITPPAEQVAVAQPSQRAELARFVFDYRTLPAEGSKVYLTDDNGNILDSSFVDAKGNFNFRKLDPTQTYMFRVDDESFDMSGAQLYSLQSGQRRKLSKLSHSFAFQPVQMVEMDGSSLDLEKFIVSYSGEDMPSSTQVYLYDEATGSYVDSAEIASDGTFSFKKLARDGSYSLKFDEEIDLSKVKLFGYEAETGEETAEAKPVEIPVVVKEAVLPATEPPKTTSGSIASTQPKPATTTPAPKAETATRAEEKRKPAEEKSPEPEQFASIGGDWVLYFDFNVFLLTEDQITYLAEEVAPVLMADEQLQIIVEGHADNIGSEAVNYRMSVLRASNVIYHLEMRGVEDTRMTMVARGETQPAASNETEEGRAKNRRVAIRIKRIQA